MFDLSRVEYIKGIKTREYWFALNLSFYHYANWVNDFQPSKWSVLDLDFVYFFVNVLWK